MQWLKDNLESDHAGTEDRLGSRHLSLILHLASLTDGLKLSTAHFIHLKEANFLQSLRTRENPITPSRGSISEVLPSLPCRWV